LFTFTRRLLPLSKERGQGLTEYGLILSLVAVVIIFVLAVLGTSVKTACCQVISHFPGSENPCGDDVVVITKAEFQCDLRELHLDATSNGDFDPDVTLTASPGGVMEARSDHYHLHYFLPDCPYEVIVTSNAGGSTSVTVGS
jgi:pilus assembly protein Flp/PilA